MNAIFKKIHALTLKFFIFAFLAETLCYCHLVTATEIDSYTNIQFLREDSTDLINMKVNLLLEQAFLKANREKVVDPEELYHIINEVLGGVFITNLEDFQNLLMS